MPSRNFTALETRGCFFYSVFNSEIYGSFVHFCSEEIL
nr:MAG TPA: hypothetical protein [Caudoviricetes sp.]